MVPYVETALDKRQRESLQRLGRQTGSAGSGGSQAVDGKPQPKARKGDRWAAHNAFVDMIAPRLSLAERAVWHVMFRHARNGTCETSVRMLATSATVSRSTAEAALRRLVSCGLVWPIWKSHDKSKASKYGMHPDPAACLLRVTREQEPSRSPGRSTDEPSQSSGRSDQ